MSYKGLFFAAATAAAVPMVEAMSHSEKLARAWYIGAIAALAIPFMIWLFCGEMIKECWYQRKCCRRDGVYQTI